MYHQIRVQCRKCKGSYPITEPVVICPNCGHGWLDTVYPLSAQVLAPESLSGPLATPPMSLWRYRPRLPLRSEDNIVSLGEGGTPLIHAARLGEMLGHAHIYIKDERQNPTGSFKDRQATVAISMMKEAGIKEAVVSSVGNAAIAYAAYAARAGIQLWVFVPAATPDDKMRETAVYGAKIIKIAGTYDETKKAAADFAQKQGLFLDRGIKGIAAKEAMKTLAFELAEQLADPRAGGGQSGRWRAPDWYVQSVSGGLGPVGVLQGFQELNDLGLVDKMPKLGCFQVNGCAPMVNAFRQKRPSAKPVTTPETNIITLTTGDPGEAYEVLFELMGKHGGDMASVSDEEAYQALRCLAQSEGISVEPATAVAFAGLTKFIKQGIIRPDETVVVNCSGHAMPVPASVGVNPQHHQPETLVWNPESPEPV